MAKKCKCQPGAPMWMVTFSDMVTLLLTFFVLLLSMASMDRVKFQAASQSISEAFGQGVMATTMSAEKQRPHIISYRPIDDDFTSRVYRRLKSKLHELKLDKQIKLVKDRGAVVLRIDEAILFESGQRTLNPAAYPVLRKVAELVRPLPLNLKVEGHTDDRGDELANWNLSVDRAVNVLRYLVSNQLVPLDRISATGYGSQKPLFPNNSEAERAKNRRVEFVLESQGDPNQELPYLIDARDQAPF